MPPVRKQCQSCNRSFLASRTDAIWCSEKCRYNNRQENALFEFGKTLPKSGTPGVTFSRIRKRWEAKVKINGNWKYIGSFKTQDDAKRFQLEVSG